MDVAIGKLFSEERKNFLESDQLKIANFIFHVNNHGLTNLTGRNKSSADVPKDDPDWLAKVTYAISNKLWHYHIGIPQYNTSLKGDQVSEYVLHYIREANYIKIVRLDDHSPFALPPLKYLE